jgi:hypothetical protein
MAKRKESNAEILDTKWTADFANEKDLWVLNGKQYFPSENDAGSCMRDCLSDLLISESISSHLHFESKLSKDKIVLAIGSIFLILGMKFSYFEPILYFRI